ncbi:MAG TPA: HPF/RaiA family ribosome-associated protein [Candidatus Polarisedimenticolia bacterium]|jgi:putative sigma-54 modulation protein|nr:HPF/RaiA family ribosome-associated protein [Candidatus Polarisedimenticolia bacterium]
MTIVFTGRKAHLTADLKALATGKLQKLQTLLGDILAAHVILKREKKRQVVEMVVKARGRTLAAEAEGAEFDVAVGLCADRLLAQARRHADRRTSRRKGRGAWKPGRRSEPLAAPEVDGDGDGADPGLVRMGRVAPRAMTVREALLRAGDQDQPVLIFRDLASERLAVLYKRQDGRYGLLETEG